MSEQPALYQAALRDEITCVDARPILAGEFEANAAEKLGRMRAPLQQRCAAAYAPPPGTTAYVLYLDDAHYRLF